MRSDFFPRHMPAQMEEYISLLRGILNVCCQSGNHKKTVKNEKSSGEINAKFNMWDPESIVYLTSKFEPNRSTFGLTNI